MSFPKPTTPAKLSLIKNGDQVFTTGFTCIDDYGPSTVHYHFGGGYYLNCSHGMHFLSGQLDEDGDTLVGVFTYPPISPKA
jgi:hypothetical protein